MTSFYVDTCVYLNLWKKEVDENGEKLWLYAKNFFELAEKTHSKIYYSGFILKEMLFLLSTNEYLEKREFFEDSLFEKIVLTEEEYKKAVKIKNKIISDCSLFDIIHISLAKKTNSILITHDRELIIMARGLGITAKTPNEVIID